MKAILCLTLVFTLALNPAYSIRSQYSNKLNAKKSHQQSSVSTNVIHKNNLSSSFSSSEKESKILRNDMEIIGDGSYHYDFETSNGIKRTEQGAADGTMKGSSSYISPEGIEIKTTYVADETGYHPIGDHIPQIPDYIVRALEYIRNHPYIEKDYYTGEVKQTSFNNKKSLILHTMRNVYINNDINKKSSHNSKYDFKH